MILILYQIAAEAAAEYRRRMENKLVEEQLQRKNLLFHD
jgi:hypothetical protein